jgi:fructose-specific phosphotransferase system component IIB
MKQETLEEAAENYGWRIKINTFSNPVKANDLANSAKQDFIEGAKWQAERSYSEEDIINALHSVELKDNKDYSKIYNEMKEWFKQFKNK